jgi:hypothetical protein
MKLRETHRTELKNKELKQLKGEKTNEKFTKTHNRKYIIKKFV